MVHFGWMIAMFIFGVGVGVFLSTLSKMAKDEDNDEANDESDGD